VLKQVKSVYGSYRHDEVNTVGRINSHSLIDVIDMKPFKHGLNTFASVTKAGLAVDTMRDALFRQTHQGSIASAGSENPQIPVAMIPEFSSGKFDLTCELPVSA
jgi:hypothetical protein